MGWWKGLAAAFAGLVMACAAVISPADAAVSVGNVPVRGWSVNGEVFVTKIVGNVVYVGGNFDTVTSANRQMTVARGGLAAFNLADGSLVTGFRADTNGIVRAIAVSGSAVYVGGTFTAVSGANHPHVAKVDAGTGAVDAAFKTSVNGIVRALAVDGGGNLVVGGKFSKANGSAVVNLVKVNGGTGLPMAGFSASAPGQVWATTFAPDSSRLYVGGSFTQINGEARAGVSALDPTSGAVVGPRFASSNSTLNLAVSPDGKQLFAAIGAGTNAAFAWNADTGSRRWRVGFEGDGQGIAYHDGTVYVGFHDGYQGNSLMKLIAVDAASGAIDPGFQPTIKTFLGVRSVDATPAGVVIGGPFTSVAGVADRGFAVFH